MKLLKFHASWCQPCKMLSRVIEDAGDLGVEIDSIDIDENMDKAKQYGVRGVPTLILVNEEGVAQRQRSGYMSEEDLKKFIKGE